MAGAGHDASVILEDGRVLEYWEGGDPAGRPVLYHPGTPVTRRLGRWGHDAAVAAGVRLIALNRPGYEGSTMPAGIPGLLGVGRDTAALATTLGIGDFAVMGCSGGGPFACATAVAAPARVRALGVIGGTGPWRVLEGPDVYPGDRACLALYDAGDAARGWACMYRDAVGERSKIEPEAYLELVFRGETSDVADDRRYRALWRENIAAVRSNLAGYVFDNVAWGVDWDVDVREVEAPTLLFYGTGDKPCAPELHGAWYADRIGGAELIVIESPGHIDVIDGHWPEVLAGLLRIWA
jgi:pimeloyl-ACP methyl ester carboxylesterase